MKCGISILFLLIVAFPASVHSQVWSKEDSLWLANILSGKDTLRLNFETQQAIKEGRLLNVDKSPLGTMKMAPAKNFVISKDFSEYIKKEKDTTHYLVALKDLPPQVFWRYGRDLDPRDAMRFSAFDRDKQAKSMVMPGADGLSFSIAALLAYSFDPVYRQKVKNRKKATAHKVYDKMPTLALQQKQRAYREAHPENVLPMGEKYSSRKYSEENLPLPDIIKRPKEKKTQVKLAPIDTLPKNFEIASIDSLTNKADSIFRKDSTVILLGGKYKKEVSTPEIR